MGVQEQQQRELYAPPPPPLGGGGGFDSQPEKKRSRKEIERALMRGDASGVEGVNGGQAVNAGNANWAAENFQGSSAGPEASAPATSMSYYDPKTGKTVESTEVSSQGKRKGHIGHLVNNAAKLEESMMFQKESAGKTKKQTNAKYGW